MFLNVQVRRNFLTSFAAFKLVLPLFRIHVTGHKRMNHNIYAVQQGTQSFFND